MQIVDAQNLAGDLLTGGLLLAAVAVGSRIQIAAATGFAAAAALAHAADLLNLPVQLSVTGLDVALTVLLLWCAHASRRWWAILAASLQSLGVAADLVLLITPQEATTAWVIVNAAWSYLSMAAVLGGVALHHGWVRRSRRVAARG